MLSHRVSIVFALGFIFVVSGVKGGQRADFKAGLECVNVYEIAVNKSLESEGNDVTPKDMIQIGCSAMMVFVRCISELDPSVFDSPAHVIHYVATFVWQDIVLANKASLCTPELQVGKLKEIAVASDIMENEGLSNVEDDVYYPCVGEAVENCLGYGVLRMERHLDNNVLSRFEKYLKCYEDEVANDCNTPMLQHFIDLIKLHKKYGKFDEMMEESPA